MRPWKLGLGLFKVTENVSVRQTIYDFLLVRHCRYSSTLYRFWVIWRWIILWPWNLVRGHSKSFKLVPFESLGAVFYSPSLFWHNIWMECGKPHTGPIADVMRKTRSAYHYAIRKAKRAVNNKINQRIADSSTFHALHCRRAVFELRAWWSISVEHSARSSQEPQSDSYNFHAPS